MSDGYEYDIFLSFCKMGSVGNWMKHHFRPVLYKCLCDELDHDPSIYYYPEQQTGTIWKDNLGFALKRSRLMVAIWSPAYFRSKWCMAEWQSMLEREKALGIGSGQKQRGLVYPIVFSDGKHFHEDAPSRLVRKDLSNWNYEYASFERSDDYHDFRKHMKDVAIEMAIILEQIPESSDEFPLIEKPDVSSPVRAELPRVE